MHFSKTLFVYKLTTTAAICSFLFGYDTGVISGAMVLLTKQYHWKSAEQEVVVSITVGAAAIFALVGGCVTRRFGRKPVIQISGAIFAVGSAILAAADGFYSLLIGRFVVGVAIGLSSMTAPMYIAEVSPTEIRGRLLLIMQVMITFGQFVAGVVDGLFSYVTKGWRWMLGLPVILALFQLTLFCWLPESPRWLTEKRRYDEAKAALLVIRADDDDQAADTEMHQLKRIYEAEELTTGNKSPLLMMIARPALRRALATGCALQMFQQLVGINTVMYYSATIFLMAGFTGEHESIWLAAVAAFMNFAFSFVGFYLIDRIGRRRLTLLSLTGVTISLLLFAYGFHLTSNHTSPVTVKSPVAFACQKSAIDCATCLQTPNCGFCFSEQNASCLMAQNKSGSYLCTSATWTDRWCPSKYGWLVLAAMTLYLFSFGAGMGPTPWTINAEIYPQWARSTGNALSTMTNWTFNLIVSLTFLSLTEAISKKGAYCLYAGTGLTAIAFFYWVLPETKERTLEETEALFNRSWFSLKRPSRNDGGDVFRLLSDRSSQSSTEF